MDSINQHCEGILSRIINNDKSLNSLKITVIPRQPRNDHVLCGKWMLRQLRQNPNKVSFAFANNTNITSIDIAWFGNHGDDE